MTYYYRLGELPHKRHTQFRSPQGQLYQEELMGTLGFSGRQSLLYHVHPPTCVKQVEETPMPPVEFASPRPLKHRLLRTWDAPAGGDAVSGRVPLLGNQDVLISIARPTQPMDYWYRFAHGDEMIFVHQGQGVLESQFGLLRYRPGDYLILPTGVMWRMLPDAGSEHRLLVAEAHGHLEPPRRYLSDAGQFLEHSPYCERDIRPPDELVTVDEKGDFQVRVKARGGWTTFHYAFHPLDVVGWDGCLWPYAFSIRDFEPITGRVHQPPPVHQTFSGPGFVVCSFVPRLFDYHPLSIPAPYNHSNVDSDEVLYYVEGHFMSRKGVGPAAMSIHPNGIPHGPHPGTYEGSIGKSATEELAVMIDTFRPLQLTRQALQFEDSEYYLSWSAP